MALRTSSKTYRQNGREPMAVNPGTSGNDIIIFTDSDDGVSIDAGAGNDEIYSSGTVENAHVDGGADFDSLFVDLTGIFVPVGYVAAVENDAVLVRHAIDFTVFKVYMTSANIERFVVTGTSIQFNGAPDADWFEGGSSADLLLGKGGNDVLDGGPGADRLEGGDGTDALFVDNAGDFVLGGAGLDRVYTTLGNRSLGQPTYVLPADVEQLSGIADSGQKLEDNALSNVVGSGPGHDILIVRNGGGDNVFSGAGNDLIFFGSTFGAFDIADGEAGRDRLGLHGDYNLVFEAASMASIERLMLWTSGDPANDFDYTITTHDANVAFGAQLEIGALSLTAAETLLFNGSAETDGSFWVRSGAGSDVITGGALADRIMGGLGGDRITGGGGADRFDVTSVAHSTSTGFDTYVGFDPAADRINISGSVARWGQSVQGEVLNGFLDASIAFWVNPVLGPGEAVKLTASGDYAGKIFVVVDVDGDGSYQGGVDYLFAFESWVSPDLELHPIFF